MSIGSDNTFNDNVGVLVATAVLIKSCANPVLYPDLVYRPTRIDLLLYTQDNQGGRSVGDFYVTLFADDGTETHNPAVQVRDPISSLLRSVVCNTARSCIPYCDIASLFAARSPVLHASSVGPAVADPRPVVPG